MSDKYEQKKRSQNEVAKKIANAPPEQRKAVEKALGVKLSGNASERREKAERAIQERARRIDRKDG